MAERTGKDKSGQKGESRNPVDSLMFRQVPCIRVNGEQADPVNHEVIEEIPFALFINGRHAMTAMMSPVQLEDFVTGYLYTEQIIRSVDEIESIKLDKNRISVITTNLFKVIGPKKTILSGCGGSTSYIDTEKLPKVISDFSVPITFISEMVRAALESDLHVRTGGIHVVGLAGKEGIIARSEDIGRHNALDRVIGYALRNGIDLTGTFAICSGRISSEMARKCLIAGIPVMVSRGATTTLAIDIARKNGLTLVGFVRSTKMMVYTHPERLEGLPAAAPPGLSAGLPE